MTKKQLENIELLKWYIEKKGLITDMDIRQNFSNIILDDELSLSTEEHLKNAKQLKINKEKV